MGTRSDIILERVDGKWARVYCQWDGYIDHNGRILHGHYASQARAEELAKPGDMSSLGERCDKPAGHSFDTRVEGCTVYYGRDQGEKGRGIKPKIAVTLAGAWPRGDTDTRYTYVWRRDGGWFVGHPLAGVNSLVPLADAIAAETAETSA